MNALWIAVAVLTVALVWLGLALAGAVRELGRLKERLDQLELNGVGEPVALRGGLPVGAVAPAWRLTTPEGSHVSSARFDRRRHVLAFADAECAACDRLIPDLMAATVRGEFPALVVIGRGDAYATPSAWRSSDERVVIGNEAGDRISQAFHVDLTPHVFVVDEGGYIVSQGGAVTTADVLALVGQADGIRIVPGAEDG